MIRLINLPPERGRSELSDINDEQSDDKPIYNSSTFKHRVKYNRITKPSYKSTVIHIDMKSDKSSMIKNQSKKGQVIKPFTKKETNANGRKTLVNPTTRVTDILGITQINKT